MAQPIKIGQLKDRITIQEASTAQNTYGEEIRTWGTLSGGDVYALVDWNNTGSGEIYSKEGLSATTSISFIIRHRTDVTPKMRVLYKSNYFY